MRRSASEIIRNLEMRIARLERNASTRTASSLAKQVVEAVSKGQRGGAYGFLEGDGDEYITGNEFSYNDIVQIDVFLDGLTEVSDSENRALINEVASSLKNNAVSFKLRQEFAETGTHAFNHSRELRDQFGIFGSPVMKDSSISFRVDKRNSRGVSISEEEGTLCFHLCVKANMTVEVHDDY